MQTDYEKMRNPERFLQMIKDEENSSPQSPSHAQNQPLPQTLSQFQKQTRGKLKIFFGYCAGIGKTYAMLCSAIAEKLKGTDVIAGYIEMHDRPETLQWLKNFEILPPKKITYNNITLTEFDLEEALKRKPKLILVDELAHTNAPKCKNKKRYQDIEDLLQNGIDVFTTVNVQHIESLNDTVASITGVIVKERIPDVIFDNADQIELIDIEPVELLERLSSGKIYKKEQIARAKKNFFTVKNLSALREIALRRTADRVNILNEKISHEQNINYSIEEHILAGLSSSPTNPKIIRTAARMANAYHAKFSCIFVQTADFFTMTEENCNRLKENINLAKSLNANIEIVFGNDIARSLIEYAQNTNVTKIIVGRSATKKRLFSKPALTDILLKEAEFLEVNIIPDDVELK